MKPTPAREWTPQDVTDLDLAFGGDMGPSPSAELSLWCAIDEAERLISRVENEY